MMNTVTLYGFCAAAMVAIGLYGLVLHPTPLRKIVAFNLLGSGTFLLFGVAARRGIKDLSPGKAVPQHDHAEYGQDGVEDRLHLEGHSVCRHPGAGRDPAVFPSPFTPSAGPRPSPGGRQ